MLLKFLHTHPTATTPKAKRSQRPGSVKRIEPDRPVRVYSLLLPPTLPHDRK